MSATVAGIGLLFMWAAAMVGWTVFDLGALNYLGMALTSAAGLVIGIYTNEAESKAKAAQEEVERWRNDAEYWKDQGQRAIALLESKSK